MSEALRFNEGKPSLAYILQFANPIKVIARIMELGAIKYDDGNWRKGGKPDREYLDSMMRHLTSWVHGEKYCDDSGCSHLGHAIWNLMALHELNHPDEIIDDEVFKRQCAHWKAKKEESHDTTDYANIREIKIPGIWQLEEIRKETVPKCPECGSPTTSSFLSTWQYNDCGWWDYHAESCLKKTESDEEQKAVKEEEEQKGKTTPPKCPECGSPTSSFRAWWECDCGWWDYKADSGLKKTESDEKQKDDIEISFTFPDDARCASFDALAKKLVTQDKVKLRDAFFNYLGDALNFARPLKDKVE